MSLVVPSITGGGSSDIKVAQREIISLDGIFNTITMRTRGFNPDIKRMTLADVNYAFSTDLGDGCKLIEASIIIADIDAWIQNYWLESSEEPLILTFDISSTLNFEGLSLSISLPFEAYTALGSSDGYISLIAQPIYSSAPAFICYPYRPGGGTPSFTDTLTDYTLTFSLLSTIQI